MPEREVFSPDLRARFASASSSAWSATRAGNWTGAAAVAGAVVGTSALAATVLALLARPSGLATDETLALITAVLGSTFGADAVLQADSADPHLVYRAGIGVFPLTASLLTALVGLLVFRRVTAGYTQAWQALADAARAAVLVGVLLMLAALAFRADGSIDGGAGSELGGPAEAGESLAAGELVLGGVLELGTGVGGAVVMGAFSTFVVLAAAVVLRRDWWQGEQPPLLERLRAPLLGHAVLLALLPVTGLLAVLGALIGDAAIVEGYLGVPLGDSATAALLTGLAANAGMWLIAVGAGAPLVAGGTYEGDDGGGSATESLRFGTLAEQVSAVWAAPLVTVVVLTVAALVVARASSRTATEPVQILGDLLRWTLSLLVVVPLLLRLSNLHVAVELSGAGSGEAQGYVGPEGYQATLYVVGLALVCALGVALLHRAVDVPRIREHLATWQARLEENAPRQPATGSQDASQAGSQEPRREDRQPDR